MKKKYKIDTTILFILITFMIISIITVYSSLLYLPKTMNNLVLKQFLFYIIGFILIFFILKIKKEKLLKYSFYIYFINILLLILVLFIGTEINGTKAWINIPIFGTFQPSEFMKIGLILYLAKVIEKSKINNDSDIVIIFKCVIIFLIPSILTFLEPDTGAIFVYFIITLVALLMSSIKSIWFILLFTIIFIICGGLFYLYFMKQEVFIKFFGTDFFYRFDRILEWKNEEGMQLKNSLIGISSSGVFGHGFNNIPIYFPELQTDFIFSSFVSCFGLFGAILLIIIFIFFDFKIINTNSSKGDKIIVICIFSVLIYQQIQNISMTIGLLPITGITLPFISYGGCSLISFMILIGIILNISKKDIII